MSDMEYKDLLGALEGILFAAGEPVDIDRIAAVLATDRDTVIGAAEHLADELIKRGSGIRLLRLDNNFQLCSAPEYSEYIRLALETRKPPKLSQSALEVLAIVAYFQPVTRAYIESVRGVDSSYTVSVLAERGLIEACGHLDAPGRPTLFRTTNSFLRTFGLSSLEELPEMPELETDDDEIKLQSSIDALKGESDTGEKAENVTEPAEEPEA